MQHARHCLALGLALLAPVACDGSIGPDDDLSSLISSSGAAADAGRGDGPSAAGMMNGVDASVGGLASGPTCGNDVEDDGEECDDGNRQSGDGCSSRCKEERDGTPRPPQVICGDNLIIEPEECDDGNTRRGDGCDNHCKAESCGNERIDLGEDCDPPLPGECDATCRGILLNCGDGEIQTDQYEQCDDGNDKAGDGCNRCTVECGDGILEHIIGEQCEPVHALVGTCTEDCHRVPACGDGVVQEQAGEECDPSNDTTCVDCRIENAEPVGGDEVDGGVPGAVNDCEPLAASVPLTNPRFDVDASGWTPSSEVSVAYSADGVSSAGSIAVTWAPGDLDLATFDGVVQCLPVRTGTQYRLKVSYKTPGEGNPTGSRASVVATLYLGASCDSTPTTATGDPLYAARDTWFEHERAIDTSVLGAGDDEARLLLKLGAIVPAGVTTGTALFDDISVEHVGTGPFCGDCVVAFGDGEACDDGNRTNGDGCSSGCAVECGNGTDDGPLEGCDDANLSFGDGCTPDCQVETACDACASGSCSPEVDDCLNLTGAASAGPRAGTPMGALCAALRSCVHETGCNGDTAIAGGDTLSGGSAVLENCYCGTAGLDCLDPGRANGSCRAEVEAALETDDPIELVERFGGADLRYPVFAALDELLFCEGQVCESSCVATPGCGDGHVQDRTRLAREGITFRIDGINEPCLDEYTATGLGCSFEECDDGNLDGGDGCDASCFVEECGNHVKQGAEECDDGNRVNDDGCSANCEAEFICGDNAVDVRFEDCDPPNSGPVCSEADYSEDATQCGCDADCAYKVCGNGVIQEGEDCDPPNGTTCNDSCHFEIDACTSCVLQLYECGGTSLLSGIPGDPQLELGCLDNPVCYDLWKCYESTSCHVKGTYQSPMSCFCGSEQTINACQGSGVPVGECREEMLAAFEAQWGSPPSSTAQVSQLLFNQADGSFAPPTLPLWQASFLQQTCLASADSFRAQLVDETDLNDTEREECVQACFQ